MAIPRKISVLIFVLMAGFFATRGQSIENLKTTIDGDRVVITYDLSYIDSNQKFRIALYSSHDNYSSSLHSITGDLGENIAPGRGKRVVWDAKNSLPADFDSDITIKVKASKIVVAAKLDLKPLAKSGFKKGQTMDVQWQGGRPTDKINIELYKDGGLQQKLGETQNSSQSYSWSIPKELKGKGYSVRISDGTDQSKSGDFSIKPKIPLLLIIAPVAVVGGVLAFSGGSKSKDTPVVSDELPGPVKPN